MRAARLHPLAATALTLTACLGAGCAGSGGASEVHRRAIPERPARDLSALALPTDTMIALQDARGTPPTIARWEFSRLDERFNPLLVAPMRATDQWPSAPRPGEYPVRFYRWEQNR